MGAPGAGKPGGTTDRLVSFVDFAPTMLSLAASMPPRIFKGRRFSAGSRHAAQFVYGARDRVDEAFDVARSVRDSRWLYIRNFMPHLSWMQPEALLRRLDLSAGIQALAAAGKLALRPLAYASTAPDLEELYDTQADPHQLHNLADDQHADAGQNAGRTPPLAARTRDAGFLTEPQMWSRLSHREDSLGHRPRRDTLPARSSLNAADAVGREEAARSTAQWLRDTDDGVRYWAALVSGPQAALRGGPRRPALGFATIRR